jgi:hypothetical protein
MKKIYKLFIVAAVAMLFFVGLSFNTFSQTLEDEIGRDGDPPRCCWNNDCVSCDICYAGTTVCYGLENCHCGQN